MTVYNSTGGEIANSQSPYPAFSFELPDGSYIFTATASSPNVGPVPLPIVAGGVSSPNSALIYSGDENEYGYAVEQVNSSQSISIAMSELSDIQSSNITVSAVFVNGTVASGASVYAYILGGDYWYYPGSILSMNNQTGSAGTTTLTVPDVPFEVTAWSWVPVNLPQSEITTEVTVGGQPVNVTADWQPTYIGLAGSALVMPPFHNTTTTLRAQQPDYWAVPQGVASTGSNVIEPGIESGALAGAVSNSPSAIPASVMAQEQQGSTASGAPSTLQGTTSPPGVATVTTTGQAPQSSAPNDLLVEAAIFVALLISAAAVVLSLRKK